MSLIERLGIVGAGQMGRGIAQVAAGAGCEVTIVDATQLLGSNEADQVHLWVDQVFFVLSQ